MMFVSLCRLFSKVSYEYLLESRHGRTREKMDPEATVVITRVWFDFVALLEGFKAYAVSKFDFDSLHSVIG